MRYLGDPASNTYTANYQFPEEIMQVSLTPNATSKLSQTKVKMLNILKDE